MFKPGIKNKLVMDYMLKSPTVAREIGKKTLLLAFKQTFNGPSCFYAERDLDFLPNGNHDIYKLGSFVSVGIGQGDSYNEGVFGPLPVLGTNWRMLVIAMQLPDPEFVDVRAKGMNYVMFCFLYEVELERLMVEQRLDIESRISQFMNSLVKVQSIDQWKMRELKHELVDAMMF
ncbi:MAG: hypothetical protein ACFFD4_23375 [Candidatus Odinarchaeota archaeon]